MSLHHPKAADVEEMLREVLARVSREPQRLSDILDGYARPLLAFTRDRFILCANPAGEGFFGYERGMLVAQSTDVIVPHRFRQPDAPPQIALDDLTTVQIPGLRRDGSEISTAWTFGSAPGPDGPIFVMVVRDSADQAKRERELEDRFRAVYENALDGICLMDDDLRFVDVNPAACRLLGRSREELVGSRASDVMPPAERAAVSRMGEFRSAGTMAGEGAIWLPDGNVRRAEFGAVANVSPGIHLSVFRDIEDRKRAEEAQRFLDEASTILAASLDYEETLPSVARAAVPRMADWAGIDLVEPSGALRRIAVAHTDPAKIALVSELRARQCPSLDDASGIGAVIRTGEPELVERVTDEALVAALGSTPELLSVVRGLGLVSGMIVPLAARGRVIGALSFVSAESRRRYGPADLAFAQELGRRAGYAIENALYVRDLQQAHRIKDLFLRRAEHLQATATKLVRAGSVAAIARAFEADDPPSPAPARGWSLYIRAGDGLELVAATPGIRETAQSWSPMPLAAENPLAEAARTGHAVWLQDLQHMVARYPVLVGLVRTDMVARAAIPLCTGDDSIGVLGVMFDGPQAFTADERAYLTAVADLWAQALHRAQLAEAERDAIRRALEAETMATRKKDEFLAMLGHELRNPLAPILTATSLLRVRGRATSRELEILDRQARHMVRLVDDLLDISRITSGKLVLRRSPVEIGDVLAQAIESTSPAFDERHIRLLPELPLPAITVNADRERLVQVFGNILVNAAKFTPAGKAVFVSAFADGAEVVVVVRDEGQGIEPELLPRVFDLFSQGPQGSDRASGGLGLGLAIAQSIAVAHGGRIDLSSPGRGGGTSVSVHVPALGSEQVAPVQVHDFVRKGIPMLLRHRVLVVDDNEDSASMLAEFLEEIGYECRVAVTAQTALSLSLEWLPNVAILDIGLPDVDGFELARRMRAELADRAPKMIALTGYAREADRDRALQAGFLEHLAKPVEMAKLTAKLDLLLSGSEPASSMPLAMS